MNRLNPTTTLSKAAAADYFLKRKTTWPDHTPVIAVDQRDASPVRQTFSVEVLGRSAAAIASYWQQQIFSGREVPPVQQAGDREVMDFVRSSPGAIGYVSSTADTADLKIVSVN